MHGQIFALVLILLGLLSGWFVAQPLITKFAG